MRIEIEYPYTEKYTHGYLTTSKKNGRKMVDLWSNEDKKLHRTSYARYLLTVKFGYWIPKELDVDHIDGNPCNDDLSNLRAISKEFNVKRSHAIREMIIRICPVCKCEFIFPKRCLNTHKNPCCSRHCGGKKSHWKTI